jgi:glycosyltransferase involved in cell wall biosynthesis
LLVTAKPRLLFVSPRFLFPTNEGGKIRTSNILRQMKGGAFEITLTSPAPANAASFSADTKAVCDHFLPWAAQPVTQLRRLLALPGAAPVAAATDRSAAGSAVIAAALAAGPDVVVVDFPHADLLMPRATGAASVLFTHNVEAEIFERHASVATGAWRLVWRNQVGKMQRFEAEVLRRYDSVIAVSARDAVALKQRYGLPVVEPIETGVDLEYFGYSDPSTASSFGPDGGTIVFTGVMDSPANTDGIDFLMNDIWPIVVRARPQARALIVGRNPQKSLYAAVQERGLNWTVTGSVDDIRTYVAQADVSVIPLRVGSGTRIKAFEAMAMGRPVVATRVGIEGLDVDPGEHFQAADTAEAFAAAILRLLEDAGLRETMARAARARLEQRFSWAHVARQFEAICQRAVDAKRVSAR